MRKKNVLAWTVSALSLLVCACNSQPNTTKVNLKAGTMAYSYRPAAGITAVFQSGLGDDKSTWSNVISQLPATQSSFVYDRYGYGKSTSASSTRDACTIAREQHELLMQAGVKPPYLLVGHSIGGLYEYVFALMYPQDVTGLVLLDPTHPEHWETVQREAPAAAAIVKTMRFTLFTSTMRKEFDAQTECLRDLPKILPASVRINTRILTSTLINAGEQGAYQDVLTNLRKDWLRLTGIAKTEPIDKASHYIQKDRPDVVVKAILAMNAQH
jgi:pimeloyl-ACP methyl ester carboxylesterase